MSFYLSSIILIEFLMIAMTVHVIHYSGFTRQQKSWFILTFVSVMLCAISEFAVHCGSYNKRFAVPLTILTVIQFSVAPLLAVFFSGALGLHKESKKAIWFFSVNALVEIALAPFGKIFYFSDEGYFRGDLFIIYEVFYFVGLLYLTVSMVIVGRRFRHRDVWTIGMVLVMLVAGVLPVTFANVHTAYIAIGMCACLCYIYYNDLVQEDTKADLLANQKKMSMMQEHTISGLANLIESRDPETGEHVSRIGTFAAEIARRAREKGIYADLIDDDFIFLLKTLAPMHDVGKIVVSDTILRKPGKLTAEEFEQIKTHASAGGTIVRRILTGIADEHYIQFASDIAKYHHERWDGTGYPEGLAGDDIPLCARIIAIADVYDALVSDRCYKAALPAEQAAQIIVEESGSHFDPQLVTVFLSTL